MKLNELLAEDGQGTGNIEIAGLALDSREVKPGSAFFAVAGSREHGLVHARRAMENGAVAIIYEPQGAAPELISGLTGVSHLIEVEGLSQKLGMIAARFFAAPSAKLKVIGFTGTNGKTSCSQFMAQAMENYGVIGTLGWGVPGQLRPTQNTTPDALALQAILADFVNQGLQGAAIEVSSHALQQGRVNGMHFDGAVYTNISRDHLDYHGSMEEYVAAKLALLRMPALRFAVVNLDDQYCAQVIAALPQGIQVWGYSVHQNPVRTSNMELLTAHSIQHHRDGLEFAVLWRGHEITLKAPLFGDFNVENMLAVFAALLAIDLPLEIAAARLQRIRPVPGRMERFIEPGLPPVFVDYAHTPDALDKVLASLKQHCRGQIWVAFGCGGNRDQGKRAQMGKIASHWADHIVLTDDNPRDENPEHIAQDILSACDLEKTRIIRDRKQAIEHVISQASASDWILIAGKGHEDYQEMNGKKLAFSDTTVVRESLLKRQGHYAYAT